MKKTILTFSIILSVFTAFSQSQNLDDYPYLLKEQDGYVISPTGDSLLGKLYFGTLPSYITFKPVTNPAKEDRIYKKDCKRAGIYGHLFKVAEFKGDAIKIFSGSDDFMEVLIEGPMRLYRRYLVTRNLANLNERPQLEVTDIVFKNDGKSIRTNDAMLAFSFPKTMSHFVEDNTELSAKIKAKQEGYKKHDLINIVREYNEWALKNGK